MKIFIRNVIILFTLLFTQKLTSQVLCSPNFTYTINGGNVTFTSTSTGVGSISTTYYWNFGNNTNASGLNLIVTNTTYTTNGTYTVTLFISSAVPSCSNQISYIINITGAITPTCSLISNFASSQGANGLVNFNNTSTGTVGGTTYFWNFGDATNSTSFSPAHTYTSNGSYTVSLAANNNFTASCVSTKTAVVVVNSICNLAANFTYTIGANGLVNFISTSIGTNSFTNYRWTFGNGIVLSGNNMTSTAQTYTANGTYVVTLKDSTSNPACVSQISQTINIGNVVNPCNLSANFSGAGTNGVFNFNNTSTGTSAGVTYLWNFGDATTSPSVSPSHTYTNAGNYTVTLSANNNYSYSCVSTKTTVISVSICSLASNFTHTVGANGLVNFSSTSTGTNALTGYSWNFGDGNNGNGANTSHVYNNGNYIATLNAVNYSVNPSCSDTSSHSIIVNTNTCIANANFSIAPTATAQYWNVIPASPANVSSAIWTWGDGSSSNTLYTSHQYSAAGTYSICLTVTVNCGATSYHCSSYYIFRSSEQDNSAMIYVNVIDPYIFMANSNIEMKSILYTIYPNPSNGDFNLNVSGLDYGLVKVSISNIIGTQVFETEVEASNGSLSKELHVNYLSNGIYFVKINSGKKEHIKKIVINN
ncbi:MAG: PKD domain-containing protein [Sphingobacteriia bacterium]|nr:PKD domain-containing protein [Candidatus Fonsibacter lacus]